ncbi:ABC transporter permease [Budvicia diplopodorum]|uniref:ABC transporter permease n=1 Tax=Budvicia diplopodorum TaxID=1119056 RepID=UPI001357723A|nr:ABC transporter permease [Budvicia diplopodorum]
MRQLPLLSLRLISLLFMVAMGTFVLLSFSPVDPIRAYIGNDLLHVPPEQYAQIAARWGLDRPLWERFLVWIGHVLQGDLGYSMVYNAPVTQVITQRFLTSFSLLACAWILSGLLGTGLGLIAGRYLNRWPDSIIRSFCYLLSSLPTFWIGILLLALFSVKLEWAPICCAWPTGLTAEESSVFQRIHHLILPTIALGLLGVGNIALHTRARVEEVSQSQFVYFAHAQGDKGWSLMGFHMLRHVLTPAICLQFASLGELLGGALLAEKIFAYPGLGQATIDAGLRGDVPLLLGIVLFITLLVFAGNTISNALLYKLNRPLRRAS